MSFNSSDIYSISVVVIGYNIEKYIERCLLSIFDQTYNNYEVIFVNDGSTDSTSNIAKNIDNNNNVPFYVIDKENGGIISARKRGVNVASGNYILFVDGDDSIEKDILESYINEIRNNKVEDYDIVVSDFYEERQTHEWIRRNNPNSYGIIEKDNFIKGILDGSFYHYMFSKMYKRTFLKDCNYDRLADITIAEDLYTNSILGTFSPKVYYINYSGYKYHYNDTSVTRDGRLDIVDKQLQTLEFLKTDMHKVCCETYDEYINYQWYLFAFGYIQTRYSFRFKKYLIKKCRPFLKGIMKNHLYVVQKFNLSLVYGRLLLFLYIYLPFIACLLDYLFKLFIDILHKLNILKDY